LARDGLHRFVEGQVDTVEEPCVRVAQELSPEARTKHVMHNGQTAKRIDPAMH
jgi:hypothetical protein